MSGRREGGAALPPEGTESLEGTLVRFGRTLRALGVRAGPGSVLQGLRALEVIDVTELGEFYWALHAVFVTRREDSGAFDLAFREVWRRRPVPARAAGAAEADAPLPSPGAGALGVTGAEPESAEPSPGEGTSPDGGAAEGEGAPGASSQEVLRKKDFEDMDEAELARARRVVAGMQLALQALPTRRFRTAPGGERVDLRASLRATVRAGPGWIPLQFRTRRRRPPPLVALCDISGSMRAYTRMLLHFLHALTTRRDRTHTFLFGTRLTNATPWLRRRDPDEALRQLAEVVLDWEGGTRIGASLTEFNRLWSRRVLTRGAVVLLITDGLDQEGGDGLQSAMRRLHASCRRLVWLNPLLRFDDFQPQAAGIRAMIRHVDDSRAVHNLESLEKLADVLQDLDRPVEPLRWKYPLGAADPGGGRRAVEDLAALWVPREARPPHHRRPEPS